MPAAEAWSRGRSGIGGTWGRRGACLGSGLRSRCPSPGEAQAATPPPRPGHGDLLTAPFPATCPDSGIPWGLLRHAWLLWFLSLNDGFLLEPLAELCESGAACQPGPHRRFSVAVSLWGGLDPISTCFPSCYGLMLEHGTETFPKNRFKSIED